MPNLDTLLIEMGSAILPNGIKLAMLIIATIGMFIVASGLYSLYELALHGGSRQRQGSAGGSMMRMLLGGAMTLPSVMFWRAADALVMGGGATAAAVLAYVDGVPDTGYCDKFTAVITLAFMFFGIVALYIAFRNADDQARGLDPMGLRKAVMWAIGGFGCIFISDIIVWTANTIGVETGFDQICLQLGSP